MSNRAVIGLGFGDEGKGVVTEYLASQDPENTVVVRFSGGQQAGHKVCKGEVEHIFSNFGSGTLSGCPTYWSEFCTFDPVGFSNEYKVLREKGVSPRIYIHPDCAVTTPYDVAANRRGKEVKHGTTGTGFFQTKNRHFADEVELTVFDLLDLRQEVALKLGFIKEYYKTDVEEEHLDAFYRGVHSVKRLVAQGIILVTHVIPAYQHKVFEGSQGLMLHEHIGTMPHCTPSDVTPYPIIHHELDEILLVTRCYQTRHGNGPMTNEEYPVELVNTERETNVSHEYQGEFRKSVLDLDQLIHAKRLGIDDIIGGTTKVGLVVTCMDQMEEYRVSWINHGHFVQQNKNAEEFVRFLGNHLGISGGLYMNNSPYSHLLEVHKSD
jgi:adenylosuccinate synthase